MASAYTADGRRRSSMTHARHGRPCELCGRTVFGNGGEVSHGRAHVRRGEAVELVKVYPAPLTTSRMFFAADDPRVTRWITDGYEQVSR